MGYLHSIDIAAFASVLWRLGFNNTLMLSDMPMVDYEWKERVWKMQRVRYLQ